MRIFGKHRWSCLAACFAYLLKMSEDDIYQIIGHDGSEIRFPHLEEPARRRGFHPQEMIRACLKLRKPVWYIEARPSIWLDDSTYMPIEDDMSHLNSIMDQYTGVLAGKFNGRQHAVVWDHRQHVFLDPAGGQEWRSFQVIVEPEYYCAMV